MSKLLRTLTWFDKRNDEWMGEVRLRGATVSQLQKLFGVPTHNPMYDCFKVERKHIPAIEKWAGVSIALNKYDYFVECTAVRVSQPAMAG